MKTKYLLLLSAAAMLSVAAASAQQPETNVPYGYLLRQAEFKITDMYDLSRFSANMGTARSAAMAGAFTSLGADLSSMNINPAGLGMYRTSEFGTTLSLMTTRDKNEVPGQGTTRGSRTSFGLNNIGAAFNLYEGSGALTSFTLGINYNKLADYNYRSRVGIAHSNATILDMFGKIINVYTADAGHNALNGNTPWNEGGAFYNEWGAVLAYKTQLIRREEGTDNYVVAGVSSEADISHYMNTLSKGSAGEYTLSGGWNFSNKFYLGFSFGMVEYYNRREVTYRELYADNNLASGMIATSMNYYQGVRTTGEGYNFKLGMIYRPTPELRIGFAVHTPGITTLRTSYNSDMTVSYSASGDGILSAWTPEQEHIERFYSPTRLLGGVSYTFGDRGVLALDYEYAAYNGMRVRGEDYDAYVDDTYKTTYKDLYKEQVKNDFRGAHALRLGGEFRPAGDLFLRAGAAYTIEGLDKRFMDDDSIFQAPLPKSSLALSAGLGCRLSPTASLDLTYAYSLTKHTLYDLYSYYYTNKDTGNIENVSINSVDLTRNRHNIMLSLNFRF